MSDELRVTVLEQRLSALRTLTAMLVAHMENNGLIDRQVLQADLMKVIHLSELNDDHVVEDMNDVFRQATVLCEHWQQQRV